VADAPTPDRTLDARGLLCPMPIVRLSNIMKLMDSGQVVLMHATDPGAVPDVLAWSKNTHHPVIHQETTDKVMSFWIQKA
jgi:TusA-related sulfurtransferase